uniref:prokineticin-2 n=1 Tax=Pristiophorus japonicus TaxID=55135 RepID=UPI00398F06C2
MGAKVSTPDPKSEQLQSQHYYVSMDRSGSTTDISQPDRTSNRYHCTRPGKKKLYRKSIMKNFSFALISFAAISSAYTAVITGACDRDQQCGGGMCCAVTLWLRSLRMCTPMGNEGDECHPLSHKVPYIGTRMHHTCPCLPNLICVRFTDNQYKCLPLFKIEDVFFEQK